MAEATYEMTEGAFEGQAQNARYAKDESLLVKFYLHPKQDHAKSAEEGRPIFAEVEYISIMVPGNKDNVVVRPASDMDRNRFPRHYAAFKNNQDQEAIEGTPLSQWPGITSSQVQEMKHFNIRTVEQLAELADSHAQKFMGINTLRTAARQWLEAAQDNSVITRMESELKDRDNQLAAQAQALEELTQRLKELEDNAEVQDSGGDSKRGSGRSRSRGAE